MKQDTSDLWPLQHGPTLPSAAVRLVLDLESRGFTFRAEGESLKLQGDDTVRETLTAADRGAIRAHKLHLLALVDYCARGVVDSAPRK